MYLNTSYTGSLTVFLFFADYQIWTVHLNVTDVNDEKPHFVNQPHPFLATVPVNPRVGEVVYELLATDPDTNSDIQYNLESGNYIYTLLYL